MASQLNSGLGHDENCFDARSAGFSELKNGSAPAVIAFRIRCGLGMYCEKGSSSILGIDEDVKLRYVSSGSDRCKLMKMREWDC